MLSTNRQDIQPERDRDLSITLSCDEPHAAAVRPVLGGLLPWFGAKRTLAPHIVAELGDHAEYVEPFMGSAAVLLAKPPAKLEVANDLHGGVTTLARVLRDEEPAKRLHAMVYRTLMSQGVFDDAAELVEQADAGEDIDPVLVAWAWLVVSWQGRNGTAGTTGAQKFTVRFTTTGGSSIVRWRRVADSIEAWHERLRWVAITQADAFELIDNLADRSGLAIYADPPYLEKGASYRHDFESHDGASMFGQEDDHDRLAAALSRFRHARVVVSYYAHPRLETLYPRTRWRHVQIDVQKHMTAAKATGSETAPEVLLINGEPR